MTLELDIAREVFLDATKRFRISASGRVKIVLSPTEKIFLPAWSFVELKGKKTPIRFENGENMPFTVYIGRVE